MVWRVDGAPQAKAGACKSAAHRELSVCALVVGTFLSFIIRLYRMHGAGHLVAAVLRALASVFEWGAIACV